jgi:hypothetical protein
MKVFTDDEMNALLPRVQPYSVAILKKGPHFADDGSHQAIWEHTRRNFGLRDDGVLAIVLPVADESDVCGICVFDRTVDESIAILRTRVWPPECSRSSASGRFRSLNTLA